MNEVSMRSWTTYQDEISVSSGPVVRPSVVVLFGGRRRRYFTMVSLAHFEDDCLEKLLYE